MWNQYHIQTIRYFLLRFFFHFCSQNYSKDILFFNVIDIFNEKVFNIKINTNIELFMCVINYDPYLQVRADFWFKHVVYYYYCKLTLIVSIYNHNSSTRNLETIVISFQIITTNYMPNIQFAYFIRNGSLMYLFL